MEINSFTSEPQYQRPDERNDVVHYIPKPVPPPAMDQGMGGAMGAMTYLDPNMCRPLFNKFGSGAWVFNRLDFFGNSIILGAICNALAFIIYGFYRCKVYRVNDTFLWSVILLFGGLGQITAGFLEYCKGRTFPCTLYLCLGFYCLTHYAYYVLPPHFYINDNTSMYYTYDDNSMAAFYAGWCFIAFALIVGSVRSNVLYILQVLTCFAFFLLRAIGEGCGSRPTKWHAAGILEAISGFFSLFVGLSQIINNETCYRMCFPTCPMSPDNDIDMLPPYMAIPGQKAILSPPVQTVQPVAPVMAQPVNPVVETPVVPAEQAVPTI